MKSVLRKCPMGILYELLYHRLSSCAGGPGPKGMARSSSTVYHSSGRLVLCLCMRFTICIPPPSPFGCRVLQARGPHAERALEYIRKPNFVTRRCVQRWRDRERVSRWHERGPIIHRAQPCSRDSRDFREPYSEKMPSEMTPFPVLIMWMVAVTTKTKDDPPKVLQQFFAVWALRDRPCLKLCVGPVIFCVAPWQNKSQCPIREPVLPENKRIYKSRWFSSKWAVICAFLWFGFAWAALETTGISLKWSRSSKKMLNPPVPQTIGQCFCMVPTLNRFGLREFENLREPTEQKYTKMCVFAISSKA